MNNKFISFFFRLKITSTVILLFVNFYNPAFSSTKDPTLNTNINLMKKINTWWHKPWINPLNHIYKKDKILPSNLIITFWATWCPPCLKELPSIEKLQIELNTKKLPFHIILVNVDEKEKLKDVIKMKNKILKTLDTSWDSEQKMIDDLGFNSLPTTVIICKSKIFKIVQGEVDFIDSKFINNLEKCLKE